MAISEKLTQELEQLNPQQKAAVMHAGGPALVLAGAGSGKTRVLTTRVAWLIESGAAHPEEILLVTFTNKAAHEMKRRVFNLTGLDLNLAGTFHSLAVKILRRHGPAIALDHNFTIYDADDQLTLLKNIYKDNGWDVKRYKPATVLGVIGQAKNNLQSPTAYEDRSEGDFGRFVATAYRLYQRRLSEENAVDFDDLLNLTVELFEKHPEILSLYQKQLRYVLVDEYQDTNRAQYLLTKYLAQPQNNLMAVGDFSQSIYAWRGADYKNMQSLERDFPDLTKYYLEQNYRSLAAILHVANDVIQKNIDHPILKLWTAKKDQSLVNLTEMQTVWQEADEVVSTIQKLHQENSIPLSEMAILYRINAQSRPFEESLTKAGIHYRLIGGFKFYERKEVKDLLGYLRLTVNSGESVSLSRVTKLGKRRLQKFWDWRESLGVEKIASTPPVDLLKGIIEATNFRDFFDPHDEDDAARLENIEELLQAATSFEETNNFLENVALVQDNEMIDQDISQPQIRDEVVLMSFHAAKGLEFEVVFMVGIEEGLLPHARSLTDKNEMAEERRLCYVGMTRAKNQLFLSYTCRRWQWGQVTPVQKSRFLSDIEDKWLNYEILEEPEWEGFSRRSSNNPVGARGSRWQHARAHDFDNSDASQETVDILLDQDSNSDFGENNNYWRRRQQKSASTSLKPNSRQRVFIPDDDLEDILNDDLDIKTFLRR